MPRRHEDTEGHKECIAYRSLTWCAFVRSCISGIFALFRIPAGSVSQSPRVRRLAFRESYATCREFCCQLGAVPQQKVLKATAQGTRSSSTRFWRCRATSKPMRRCTMSPVCRINRRPATRGSTCGSDGGPQKTWSSVLEGRICSTAGMQSSQVADRCSPASQSAPPMGSSHGDSEARSPG